MMFQESSKGVKVRLKGISSSCKGVSMVFKRSLTGVSVKSQRCFKEVSKKFQVWKKSKGNFREFSNVFQGWFKEVSRVFKGCFQDLSRKFQGWSSWSKSSSEVLHVNYFQCRKHHFWLLTLWIGLLTFCEKNKGPPCTSFEGANPEPMNPHFYYQIQ